MFLFGNDQYGLYRDVQIPQFLIDQDDIDFRIVCGFYGNGSAYSGAGSHIRRLYSLLDSIASGIPQIQPYYIPNTVSGDSEVAGAFRNSGGTFLNMNQSQVDGDIEDNHHYLSVVQYRTDINRAEHRLFKEGETSVECYGQTGTLSGGYSGNFTTSSRLVLGTPNASGDLNVTHGGPVFFLAISTAAYQNTEALEALWNRTGGPRPFDFIGDIATEVELLIIKPLNNRGVPSDSNQMQWWVKDVDGGTNSALVTNRTVLGFDESSAVSPSAMSDIATATLYDSPWAGFYDFETVSSLGLTDESGVVPQFKSVVSGTRSGSLPLVAWGLGNSRWANASQQEELVDGETTPLLVRNGTTGLRMARPSYDGGQFIFDLQADDPAHGFLIHPSTNSGITQTQGRNFDRFGWGSSNDSALGPGRPIRMDSGAADFSARFDLVNPDGSHADELTRHVCLVLMFPGGGTVSYAMDQASQHAAGAGSDPGSATDLSGDGGTLDTDTTTLTRTIDTVTTASVSATTYTSKGATVEIDAGTYPRLTFTEALPGGSLPEPGDLVFTEGGDINEIIAADTGGVTLRWSWVTTPSSAEDVLIGPWSYRLIGFDLTSANASLVARGIRLTKASGGPVEVIGAGYLRPSASSICYVVAGRGGKGQTWQRDNEAGGAMSHAMDTLGVGLVFAGLATQDSGYTQEAFDQIDPSLASTLEWVGTSDTQQLASAATLGVDSQTAAQTALGTFASSTDKAVHAAGAYETTPTAHDQLWLGERLDVSHWSARGAYAAGDRFWDYIEANSSSLLLLPSSSGVAQILPYYLLARQKRRRRLQSGGAG